MSTELAVVSTPRIHAANGAVHIQDLTTADPDVFLIVSTAEDPEAQLQRVLSFGGRALRVTQASIDTTMVEESFAALSTKLGQHIDQASTRLGTAAHQVLHDPNNGVAPQLATWQREVDNLLDATFDPDRRGSAFGKFNEMLTEASDAQLSATRRLLNVDAEDSPVARLLSVIREQVKTIRDEVAKVGEQVAANNATDAATRAMLERTAIKGIGFEAQVADAVTGFAATHGDIAEAVGRIGGSAGGLTGDITVDLDPSATGSVGGRYVLECKDRRRTLRVTLNELDKAATNREAQAAIAVFSRPEHSPVPDPFTVFDNRAIVVLDKDQPDPAALRLACTWARWITQRDSRPDEDRIDGELIRQLLDDARRALVKRTAIRAAHSTALKKIQEAGEHVDEVHDNLADLINRIEDALTS
jgi:hypothetical protein